MECVYIAHTLFCLSEYQLALYHCEASTCSVLVIQSITTWPMTLLGEREKGKEPAWQDRKQEEFKAQPYSFITRTQLQHLSDVNFFFFLLLMLVTRTIFFISFSTIIQKENILNNFIRMALIEHSQQHILQNRHKTFSFTEVLCFAYILEDKIYVFILLFHQRAQKRKIFLNSSLLKA